MALSELHVEIYRPPWVERVVERLLTLADDGLVSEAWAIERSLQLMRRFTQFRLSGSRTWQRLPPARLLLWWECTACGHPNGKEQDECMVCGAPQRECAGWSCDWEDEG